MSTSTQPEEPTSQVHHHDSPNTSGSTAHTVLSFLEQATSREGRPDSTASNMLGTAHNMLHRLTSSSSSTQHAHAHATPSPEALLEEAAVGAAPTVLGTAQNMFSKLTHATHHATPAPQTQSPVPHLLREQPTGASSTEGPQQRAVHPSAQGQAPSGIPHVTPSYPAIPEAVHPSRPGRIFQIFQRRPGTYTDSEKTAAWYPPDDGDPYRERSVRQRLEPTFRSAETEFIKSTEKAQRTGLAQNIAIALQVLLGALTTALGAALSGKKTSVAVSILGGASTLVASFIARTKGTNEPQASKFRARALDHFKREIMAFNLDHGHEITDRWDDKIDGFRLGLERILGNQPGSVRVDGDMSNNPNGEKWGTGMNPNVGPGGTGNGKYSMSMANKTGFSSMA